MKPCGATSTPPLSSTVAGSEQEMRFWRRMMRATLGKQGLKWPYYPYCGGKKHRALKPSCALSFSSLPEDAALLPATCQSGRARRPRHSSTEVTGVGIRPRGYLESASNTTDFFAELA